MLLSELTWVFMYNTNEQGPHSSTFMSLRQRHVQLCPNWFFDYICVNSLPIFFPLHDFIPYSSLVYIILQLTYPGGTSSSVPPLPLPGDATQIYRIPLITIFNGRGRTLSRLGLLWNLYTSRGCVAANLSSVTYCSTFNNMYCTPCTVVHLIMCTVYSVHIVL